MSLLIYSGILYLIGVSVILALKPSLMFSTDGNWKEFGIGRAKERYTWMPFWLFTILWAIMSYTIVLVLIGDQPSTNFNMNMKNNKNMRNNSNNMTSNNIKNITNQEFNELDMDELPDVPMKKGYYILNTNAMKNGSPQYIYLGPKAPNLHYEDN